MHFSSTFQAKGMREQLDWENSWCKETGEKNVYIKDSGGIN